MNTRLLKRYNRCSYYGDLAPCVIMGIRLIAFFCISSQSGLIGYIRVSSVDQNSEIQMEGIAIAKQKGKFKGRKPRFAEEEVISIRGSIKGERKYEIARDLDISWETLFKRNLKHLNL